jgi:hypothetical protein
MEKANLQDVRELGGRFPSHSGKAQGRSAPGRRIPGRVRKQRRDPGEKREVWEERSQGAKGRGRPWGLRGCRKDGACSLS